MTGVAHDVFISYASSDKPVADAVCAALEQRGLRCWIAPRDILPGLDWGAAIIGAISDFRVMVLVFSSHANRSRQIKREVERAVSKGVTVVPLRIEDVPPARTLEYVISTPHWLDALTPPLAGHLTYLAETVQLLLARGTRDSTEIPVMTGGVFAGPGAAALLALAALFLSRGGSPPEILALDFPAAMTVGSRGASGSIQFRDPEGDLVSAQFAVGEAAQFEAVRIDPPVRGQKAGRFSFALSSAVAQKVTLEATLTDAAGRRSDPFRFSFDVRKPLSGRRNRSFTIDTPHFRIGVP